MKINDNGVIREMTEEEVKEYTETMSEEHFEDVPLEDRVADMEKMMNALLGVTE